jgi:hypothetical protein
MQFDSNGRSTVDNEFVVVPERDVIKKFVFDSSFLSVSPLEKQTSGLKFTKLLKGNL